jgi:Xaa-Pro aminopeptidase
MSKVFPDEEYDERLERLRSVMATRALDAVIVDESEMLHYFTGFAISENIYRAAIIPREGTPVMIVRKLDEQPFLNAAWIDNRRAFVDIDDPIKILGDVLGEMGAKSGRIGLDMNSYCMPVARFGHLKQVMPGADFVDMNDVFRPMRLQKSPAEIVVLKKAAAVADAAMVRAIAAAVPGASSRQAAAEASKAFIELGADFGRTGPITVGRGWNFMHGKLSDDPLQPGDILHIELVPKVNGYCARLMRPAVMGDPSSEVRDATAELIALQDQQFAAMKPGANAGEVDAILRDGAVKAGLRPDYVNNTGYTLGYYFEQAPRTSDFTRVFTRDADWQLEAGMAFHMYTSASAGVAISETILVTLDGAERLTQIERRLFQCGERVA